MPKMFGKGKRKKQLIKNLPELLRRVQEEHLVSASDIPPAEHLQEKLEHCDFSKFPTLKISLTEAVDSMLGSLHILQKQNFGHFWPSSSFLAILAIFDHLGHFWPSWSFLTILIIFYHSGNFLLFRLYLAICPTLSI